MNEFPACSASSTKPLIIWLLGTCFLVWLMIMLGGATRLTHAGLSIVEWKPVTGIIPPLNEGQWINEFNKYKKFSEYQQVNQGMGLGAFKFIYFMEYAHRLLGRLAGLWFALPALFFWKAGRLPSLLKKRIFIVLGLGLCQGFLGWYMVKSGLGKDPVVSPYRLTAHLALAVALYIIVLWTAFDVINPGTCSLSRPKADKIRHMTCGCCAMLCLTILYGGLVAGLKAGFIYNTFPLMEGQFLAGEWNFYNPFWKNFLENPAFVQWIHRWLGVSTFAVIAFSVRKIFSLTPDRGLRRIAVWWAAMAALQVALGISTLLLHVPVSLGTLHQGNAIIVLGFGLYILYPYRKKLTLACPVNSCRK